MTSVKDGTRLAFHRECDAHTAADAECRETFMCAATLHLMQKSDKNARARCADRVADGDRAAVDIDDAGIPAEILIDSKRLRREGFIGLDEIEILDLPAGLLERLAGRWDRARAHDRRINARRR